MTAFLFQKNARKTIASLSTAAPWVACCVGLLGLGVIPAAAWAQTRAEARAEARFGIYEYRVEGNSLLPDAAVERAVMPHMGDARTLADVEAARQNLARQYHDAGYLTVQVAIPEQQVTEGVVVLQVVEVPVSSLKVMGSNYHLPSQIKATVSELGEGKVPNFNRMQQQLTELNRAADIKVSPVLKPGTEPGTVAVQLEVDDQLPFHGNVEFNTRQGLNTSATRVSAGLRYDNLWQEGHSVGINLQASPQSAREVRSVSLNYLMPNGSGGQSLSLYAASSRSQMDVLYNQPGLGLVGNTDMAGVRQTIPLAGAEDLFQTMSFGLDYKVIRQTLSLTGVSSASPTIRYAPLGISYRAMWLKHQPQPSVFDAGLVMGWRGLLSNSDARFEAKRPGSSASFMALRLGGQVSESVQKWTLTGRADLQLASGPLLPSEQYSAGGADTVRGYYEGERLGDQAIRMSFELVSPSRTDTWLGSGWRVQWLGFVDEAMVQTLQPATGQAGHSSLVGLGGGVRMSGPNGLGVQLDVARALRNGDVSGGGTRKGDWRLHARMTWEY